MRGLPPHVLGAPSEKRMGEQGDRGTRRCTWRRPRHDGGDCNGGWRRQLEKGNHLTPGVSGRMENSTTNSSVTGEVSENLNNLSYVGDNDYQDTYSAGDVYRMVAFSVVFLLGTVGNGLVIWFVVFKMKKTVNSVWFLSLAIADFTFSLFQPLYVTRLALPGHWPFGDFMCKLNAFILPLNMFSSVLQLTVISIDRCACVVFPVWSRNHRTTRLALIVTLGVWILAAGCSLPYFIFAGTRTYGRWMYCGEKWSDDTRVTDLGRVIMRFILFFVIPFIIIVSCYTVIIVRIRRHRMVTSTKPFRMIAAVISSFFICWLPFHFFTIMGMSVWVSHNYHLYTVSYIGFFISSTLAYANSCVNPFLYVFFGRDFKEKFWSSIPSALRRAFTEEPDCANPEIHPAQRRLSAHHDGGMELSPQNPENSQDH